MMEEDDIILITGANGLVGSHLLALLRSKGFRHVVGIGSRECDLTEFAAVRAFFAAVRPLYVFHAAAYVAGIMGNMRNQALSFLRNTLINTHVVAASHLIGVRKICALGTVAMYPDAAAHAPLREATVWDGPPHASERGYAHAKRGLLAQLDVYRESYGLQYACALSTNLYGPNDRFDIENGHVIPSLMRKFFEARQSGDPVTVWGDGSARRDFLHVEDAARALCVIMDQVDGPVNLATGETHAIREVVAVLAQHTGLTDRIVWDTTKPSGQFFREYDVSTLRDTGFRCQVDLPEGLRATYGWYATHASNTRR
jgi:GDP-L-fucose synthase